MATASPSKSASKPAHSKSSKSSSPPKVDAIKLLTADHEQVDKLFKAYDKLAEDNAAADEREALAAEICALLTVHTTIEEEIFYPAARDAEVDVDLLDEAEVEHASAKDLIQQLSRMSPDEDLYDAKVKVLGEFVKHHVGEEQDEMFPKCRKSSMDLEFVGAALAQRKAELMAKFGVMADA